MGIQRETNKNIPSAATLNKALRAAARQSDAYVSSSKGEQGAAADPVRLWFADTPLGPALAGGIGGGLCLLTFPPDETLGEADAQPASVYEYIANTTQRFDLPISWNDSASHPLTDQLAKELAEWFSGARRDFEIPLVLRGTPFQQRVWKALQAIPYGAVRSYGDLARSLGKPEAAQAVGAANGRNPVALIVPCHRVIGANGSLTGYAGGLDRKRFLLALEQGNAAQGQEQGQLF